MNRSIASALLIPILLLAGCVQIQIKERPTAANLTPEPARTMLLDNPIEWDREVLVVVRVRLWGQPTMEEGVRAMRRVGRAKGWQETSKETLMSTTPPGGEGFTLEPGKAHRLAIFPCGLRFPGPA